MSRPGKRAGQFQISYVPNLSFGIAKIPETILLCGSTSNFSARAAV